MEKLNLRLQFKMTEFIIISAISENMAIGKSGDIPWYIPEDFKHFKQETLNCPCIMGEKTYISLPIKPLPKRENIVLSRSGFKDENCTIFDDFDKSIEYCRNQNYEKVFIIGGGMIYKLGLKVADVLNLTRVHKTIENADTFFPEINWDEWKLISKDIRDGFTFEKYIRKKII